MLSYNHPDVWHILMVNWNFLTKNGIFAQLKCCLLFTLWKIHILITFYSISWINSATKTIGSSYSRMRKREKKNFFFVGRWLITLLKIINALILLLLFTYFIIYMNMTFENKSKNKRTQKLTNVFKITNSAYSMIHFMEYLNTKV